MDGSYSRACYLSFIFLVYKTAVFFWFYCLGGALDLALFYHSRFLQNTSYCLAALTRGSVHSRFGGDNRLEMGLCRSSSGRTYWRVNRLFSWQEVWLLVA